MKTERLFGQYDQPYKVNSMRSISLRDSAFEKAMDQGLTRDSITKSGDLKEGTPVAFPRSQN